MAHREVSDGTADDERVRSETDREDAFNIEFAHCSFSFLPSEIALPERFIGAACLENAIVPPGHRGPLQDRCRPDRCANSIITPNHLPIWASERHTLLTLLDTRGITAGRKAVLERELADVDAVLNRAAPTQEPR
ncbi:hypothetical protein AB0L63_19365 [Nocardia sp. NPDC051990]|uniref:hypothetical protein n=1 Tax=Nocardia sp. NPDC051990 TaxID=3155285 RepID=UPI003413F7FF